MARRALLREDVRNLRRQLMDVEPRGVDDQVGRLTDRCEPGALDADPVEKRPIPLERMRRRTDSKAPHEDGRRRRRGTGRGQTLETGELARRRGSRRRGCVPGHRPRRRPWEAHCHPYRSDPAAAGGSGAGGCRRTYQAEILQRIRPRGPTRAGHSRDDEELALFLVRHCSVLPLPLGLQPSEWTGANGCSGRARARFPALLRSVPVRLRAAPSPSRSA